jgi:uncharacterized membrane protein
MMLGGIINFVYPLIGIANPITVLPIIITWTVSLLFLLLIACIVDRKTVTIKTVSSINFQLLPMLFLVFLPLLSVLGARFVIAFHLNTVLIIVLFLVALIPLFSIFTKYIPEELYPFALYSAALSLLLHYSLSFQYLVGADSFVEYHFLSQVLEAGVWDWSLPHDYNAMLSVTILPAVLSQLLHVSGTTVFKVIYPVLYALMPLTLYVIYSKYHSKKQSFLAVFFFISIYVFFLQMPGIGRQMIAEFFYALIILIIVENVSSFSYKLLLILFGFSLIVSHYSLSYLFIGFLIVSFIILFIFRIKSIYSSNLTIILFGVFCLSWYMFVSSSEPLTTLTFTGKHIYDSLLAEFLNPLSRDVSAVFMGTSPDALHWLHRILWYVLLFFTAVGAITIWSDFRRKSPKNKYDSLAIGNYILLGICIVIPFFSNALGVYRMLHISSIVLAPYCILGAEIIFNLIVKIIKSFVGVRIQQLNVLNIIAVILIVFCIFTTTVPFVLTRSEEGRSAPLTIGYILSGEDILPLQQTIQYRSASPIEQEVYGAQWFKRNRNQEYRIAATFWQTNVPALVSYGTIPVQEIDNITPLTTPQDIEGDYIFLGYVNVVYGYGTTRSLIGKPDPSLGGIYYWPISEVDDIIESTIKLYSNGATEVRYLP